MNQNNIKQTVLVVDDAPENIELLSAILQGEYSVKVALNGKKALEIATNPDTKPDLILLDVMMPEMDGFEVCRLLKISELTRKIPVIFVSALSEVGDENRGFEVGGVDYIFKPVVSSIVRARVKTHLTLYDQNRFLEERVRERTSELVHTQDVTIVGFATLAEFRDNETGGHIIRTQQYVKLLAQYLIVHPHFSHYLSAEKNELIYKSAPLHDIGKIAVPDHILLKPGKLTPKEYEIMKKHTQYGRDAIQQAEKAMGNVENTFLSLAKEIAYTHHEKWDGTGYPQGLKGKEIPISGRLMAVADVYDALISERIYKEALTPEEAADIIYKDRGKHFDPDVVDAFMDLQGVFWNIARNVSDTP